MNIFENERHSNLIDNIYGNGYSNSLIQPSQRLQQNETLIKIMLIIISFSSNSSIVIADNLENNQTIINTNSLIHIQNIFVTMFWKYLIYQYGFNEAIFIFSSLVKSILDMLQRVEKGLNIQKHWSMVDDIVQRTTHSLIIEEVPSRD